MSFDKSKLPTHGLGLGLRRSIFDKTLDFWASSDNNSLLEWLEIVPENYISKGGKSRAKFERVLELGIPIIPHGVNLSIGTVHPNGTRPCDENLIAGLKDLFAELKPPWFSDHLSCTCIDGVYLQDLIPVPFTREGVSVISDNIKFLQDEFQLPFLVENPSYYTTLVEPEMSEAEFINSVMERADCGLLLDVNNIFVNSRNHNYDIDKFIDEINLDRATQIHIAGHLEDYTASLSGEKLGILDTHGASIRTEVYEILAKVLERTEINAILLERDGNFPESFSELVDELRMIREIMNASKAVAA